MKTQQLRSLCVVLSLFAGAARVQAGSVPTLLALGDSIAFGETVFSPDTATYGPYADPSDGNRGFVAMVAQAMTARSGVATNVVNLAIDGETSSSFFSGSGRVPPGPGLDDNFLASLNTHYTGPNPPTQAALLASTLATTHDITKVTISLGSNDLLLLAMTDPNPAADLPAVLNNYAANYAQLLTILRTALPEAEIDLLGTYNPFTALPGSPFAGLAGVAIPYLNSVTAQLASAFNANYIDLFNTPLTTDAANTTLILNNSDVHPAFDAGYAIIAGQIEAVPEPATMISVLIGGSCLVVPALARRFCRAA